LLLFLLQLLLLSAFFLLLLVAAVAYTAGNKGLPDLANIKKAETEKNDSQSVGKIKQNILSNIQTLDVSVTEIQIEEFKDDLIIFPIDGFGTKEQIRSFIRQEKPDADVASRTDGETLHNLRLPEREKPPRILVHFP
jgi:hypothetical protein